MGGASSFPVIPLSTDFVVVVTGGNAGIGYEASKHIAMMGANVIIACRSRDKAIAAIEQMEAEFQEAKVAGKLNSNYTAGDKLRVEFMEVDLSSLKSTMAFIEAFKNTGKKLHVLACNAGIALVPRGFTEDGFENQFQVNYLSHFLIVSHLLPIMLNSGNDCRIIFTSSAAHKSAASFNLETSQAPNPSDYQRLRYYGNSKLFQLQHMMCLHRRLKDTNVTVTSLHPGLVDTGIPRNYEDMKCLHCVVSCFSKLNCLRSPLKGAETLIDAAVNHQKKGVSGVYLYDCRSSDMSSDARNPSHQEELWNYSLDCLKAYLPDQVISSMAA